jgi:dTDP-4-amino-4,6-dideoxygalactose transaminase
MVLHRRNERNRRDALPLAALDLEIGDEVVSTSVTDMGAIAPIIMCGAVPVFADIGARTFNVSAAAD